LPTPVKYTKGKNTEGGRATDRRDQQPGGHQPAMRRMKCHGVLPDLPYESRRQGEGRRRVNSRSAVRTRFVPSPISCSCALAACTSSLAAGWLISSSVTMVDASLVTKSRSRWLITILFMPVHVKNARGEARGWVKTSSLDRSIEFVSVGGCVPSGMDIRTGQDADSKEEQALFTSAISVHAVLCSVRRGCLCARMHAPHARTVGSQGCPRYLGHVLACLYISKHCFIHSSKVLVPLLQHTLQTIRQRTHSSNVHTKTRECGSLKSLKLMSDILRTKYGKLYLQAHGTRHAFLGSVKVCVQVLYLMEGKINNLQSLSTTLVKNLPDRMRPDSCYSIYVSTLIAGQLPSEVVRDLRRF